MYNNCAARGRSKADSLTVAAHLITTTNEVYMFYNIGINDGKYKTKSKGKHLKEYKSWAGMLARCYSENTQTNQKSYIGCSVSDNFKSYSYFYEWCQNQVGFHDGYDLDKDLLIKGNRRYSEDICVFIPQEINRALSSNDKNRGSCLVGVNLNKKTGKYISHARMELGKIYLGAFDTEIEAFLRYKEEKEAYIRRLAEKHRSSIDFRAYKALMDYKVNFND